MKKIQRFKFYYLRSAEHIQYHRSVSVLLRKSITHGAGRQLGLTALWNTYHSFYLKEDMIFKQSRRLEETKELVKIDKNRKAAFKAIKYTIMAAIYSQIQAIQATGEKLNYILNNYKDAFRQSYGESIAEITNFIHDLQKPSNEEDVELIGLKEAIEALSTINKLFETIYNKRSNDLRSIEEQGTMLQIRSKVDKAYNELVNGINSLYVSNELTGQI
ncbi:MAG: DUF6261 family protein [Tannerellaceae bacterium]|jgi:hypothetical protein|nr:DUF6261 family protein [Tannerellaceae bacterium]